MLVMYLKQLEQGETMTKDEALKLAMEALEGADQIDCDMQAAITAIKEALAQEQEPVAWGVFEGNLHDMFFSPSEAQEMADLKGTHAEVRPLYTSPPQRKPLTDEDVERIVREARVGEHGIGYTIARAIEAAHGIKE